MTTLNVILDEAVASPPTSLSRYARELTSALIEYAPPDCFVGGIVGSSPEEDYERLDAQFPGLAGLFKSALSRRELTLAWQRGFTPVPAGMIHAPSLFAPLRNHDRLHNRGNQITVTIHDVAAWTTPELLTPRQVSGTKAMANRAFKYADAVVVPTHALAAELGTILPFGDRVRVLGAAVSPALRDPDDGDERARRLNLPTDYLLTVGDLGFGLDSLLSALATLKRVSLPLVVSGDGVDPAALADAAARAGLDADRIVAKPMLDDADRAVVLRRARAFIFPTTQSGFGTPILEAFRFECPVIHSDAPGLVEVAGDAGFAVPSSDQENYPGLLAEAIENVLDDETLRRRLGILGSDREKLFTWRTPAEGVWQLQADL